jgi:hypothetical protein
VRKDEEVRAGARLAEDFAPDVHGGWDDGHEVGQGAAVHLEAARGRSGDNEEERPAADNRQSRRGQFGGVLDDGERLPDFEDPELEAHEYEFSEMDLELMDRVTDLYKYGHRASFSNNDYSWLLQWGLGPKHSMHQRSIRNGRRGPRTASLPLHMIR